MQYSPIARSFYRLRRLLVETLGVPRNRVKPTATFEELVPADKRGIFWDALEADGLRIAYHALPERTLYLLAFAVLGLAGAWAFLLESWLTLFVALIEFSWLASRISRRWLVQITPAKMTVGEAAICFTPTRECEVAGYRLSQRDIAAKVKLILWRATGAPFDQITPEKGIWDLA
ncbi:MAG: hypothetical protein L0Y72_32425 [Gemmataceae bacterium]|nr:hypothetical protein [Gemmataceae bacterium]MCI0743762.1 hypothetical protein [Gemmataceae bacterium]